MVSGMVNSRVIFKVWEGRSLWKMWGWLEQVTPEGRKVPGEEEARREKAEKS